ncbi:hypothetical protein [Rhodococcus qingshengii]|uniref:hypothetical protein n=1 Tax=Rhodococcus qingshengii TaxID=334542 RepID=UPI001BE7E20B|nr:hypothetical protein [Rhodococcus qingshengii]MBT2271798.1 hypothetical protein [Rhodococcus qingshengii]
MPSLDFAVAPAGAEGACRGEGMQLPAVLMYPPAHSPPPPPEFPPPVVPLDGGGVYSGAAAGGTKGAIATSVGVIGARVGVGSSVVVIGGGGGVVVVRLAGGADVVVVVVRAAVVEELVDVGADVDVVRIRSEVGAGVAGASAPRTPSSGPAHQPGALMMPCSQTRRARADTMDHAAGSLFPKLSRLRSPIVGRVGRSQFPLRGNDLRKPTFKP